MARFSLIGPSYVSQSVVADCQRTVNRYIETIESGTGKSAAALYPTPGLLTFATLPDSPVRGFKEINGRVFAVAGTKFCELFSNGSSTVRGTVYSDGTQASLSVNQLQVLLASQGHLYCFTLATNAFQEIDTTTLAALQGPVSQVGFTDGYFLATLQNSQRFQISSLLDGTTWNPLDIAQMSLYPDNFVAMVVDHREPWFMGPKAIVPYYDSGNPDFPFDPVPGAFIEQGCGAKDSIVKLDNTIFWLDQDERGNLIARRANGYNGVRVSTHATEFAWQSYATASDAIGYAYQDQGHAFWVLYFPTANKTWVYDVATNTWHERESLVAGNFGAHLSRCYVFAFGKHLVGDWNSGKVYDMSIRYYDENGTSIRRLRTATHIAQEDQWMYHQQLQVIYETGNDPVTLYDGAGNPRAPQCMMRFSDDYGRTWSNLQTCGIGKTGEYQARVIFRRLGRARDRVYEITDSDPVPSRIIDGYLIATPGYGPSERLVAQMGKMA